MENNLETKQLRSFGLLVGGIFALMGLWPMLFGRGLRLWAIIPAAILLVLGSLLPTSLRAVYKMWMLLGHTLGWINTGIILSVAFLWNVLSYGIHHAAKRKGSNAPSI
jgi:hypothetical protein